MKKISPLTYQLDLKREMRIQDKNEYDSEKKSKDNVSPPRKTLIPFKIGRCHKGKDA